MIYGDTMPQDMFKKSEEACSKIAKNPYFDMDIIVGKPWRIYYTWNLKLDTKCLDMKFSNATSGVSINILIH